jgi:hypothetical protein
VHGGTPCLNTGPVGYIPSGNLAVTHEPRKWAGKTIEGVFVLPAVSARLICGTLRSTPDEAIDLPDGGRLPPSKADHPRVHSPKFVSVIDICQCHRS